MSPTWSFQRPSGGLDAGGDISKAFRGESSPLPGYLDAFDPGHAARLFARELVQNAVDAREDHIAWCKEAKLDAGHALRMEFEFETLTGEALEEFVNALELASIDGRADAVGTEALKLVPGNYFEDGSVDRPLRVLRVNELATTGMFGPWLAPATGRAERRMHSALLDLGTSEKSGRSGGSYGYGKAGLANASRTRMVFVYTCFAEERRATSGATRRLIGVSYWDKHDYEDREFIGVGVFGGVGDEDRGEGVPLDDDAADLVAPALGISTRDPSNTTGLGTSYLVVDPDFGPEQLRDALELSWWPALRRGSIELSIVDKDSAEVFSPRATGTVVDLKAFVTALEWLDNPSTAPSKTDPSAVVQTLDPQTSNKLGIQLPSPGQLALLVDDADDGWSWSDPTAPTLVALTRGTNMVIAYRPFKQALPCARGVFCASADADPFLRSTETKAHDRWKSTAEGGIPPAATQMALVTEQRIRDAVLQFLKPLKPESPKREIALDQFGSFFTGKRGSSTPRPKATKDAWTIGVAAQYADPDPENPGALAQEGVITVGLSANTKRHSIPVRVEIRFGASEDGGTGFGSEGLEVASTVPGGWTRVSDASDRERVVMEGTLERDQAVEFDVASGPYPDSWACGFQARVIPNEEGATDATA
jgi:hypothetical protein